MDQLAVESDEPAEEAVAQSHGAFDDRVKDWLNVHRRARNDAQNVAGRGLSGEGIGKVRVTRLELLEEPHILDGDYGLVGEGLEEADLGIRERLHFGTA